MSRLTAAALASLWSRGSTGASPSVPQCRRRQATQPEEVTTLTGEDESGFGGPDITQQKMIDYLHDRLDYDPVTQQWLDQVMAATDDLRGTLGVDPDRAVRLPSARNFEFQAQLWPRLIRDSEHDVCEHIVGRPQQPIVIIPQERRQLCGPCWDANLSPVRTTSPWAMTNKAARQVPCDGCGERRFTNITGDDPFGWLHPQFHQWWNYCARLRLCFTCYKVINERDDRPPDLTVGIIREWQRRRVT